MYNRQKTVMPTAYMGNLFYIHLIHFSPTIMLHATVSSTFPIPSDERTIFQIDIIFLQEMKNSSNPMKKKRSAHWSLHPISPRPVACGDTQHGACRQRDLKKEVRKELIPPSILIQVLFWRELEIIINDVLWRLYCYLHRICIGSDVH